MAHCFAHARAAPGAAPPLRWTTGIRVPWSPGGPGRPTAFESTPLLGLCRARALIPFAIRWNMAAVTAAASFPPSRMFILRSSNNSVLHEGALAAHQRCRRRGEKLLVGKVRQQYICLRAASLLHF